MTRSTPDKEKAKTLGRRTAQVRPDDAGLRDKVAQQMRRWGDHSAAAEHYLAAIRKEPLLFAHQYWEIQEESGQRRSRTSL